MSRPMHARIARYASTAVLLATCLIAGSAVFGQVRDSKPLWQVVSPEKEPPRAAEVVNAQVVRIDVKTLTSSDNSSFLLELPDGRRVQIVKTRDARKSRTRFGWHGKIDGEPQSSVTFAVTETVVIGTVLSSRGVLYRVRYWKDDLHIVERVDTTKLPKELAPATVGSAKPQSIEAATCATDNGAWIDVMVVYTDDARDEAGGVNAIEGTIDLAIDETNDSYANSDIQQRLRLAHVAEVDYDDEESSPVDVEAARRKLQDKTDGTLDNVHWLRDQYATDAVVLITETGACGVSKLMETPDNAFEAYAFAVVARRCATGVFSFGHELGHIMGARHDRKNDAQPESQLHPYNRGHLQPHRTANSTVPNSTDPWAPWRTMMAENDGCNALEDANRKIIDCTRQPYWSNPDVTYSGDPTGVPNSEDNHLVLNSTALIVANFRCSLPIDVWMRDTWNDTGAEPDPSQAGQPMWNSPYIWVRNSADPAGVFAHDHQNPQRGQANFIYVKLHNKGAATLGTLEVYGAPASTALSWPAQWSLLTSSAISLRAAGSTIVELPWIPTASGHYCLLARWVSDEDPMTTPEGPDINANVRASNNLIWRNVNVIDLLSQTSATASFIVRNVEVQSARYQLKFQPRLGPGGFVAVQLELPEQLLRSWSAGGFGGFGFSRGMRRSIVIDRDGAVLGAFNLPPGFEAPVVIRFERPRRFPRGAYQLDVVQTAVDGSNSRIVGGVTYDIRTNWLGR